MNQILNTKLIKNKSKHFIILLTISIISIVFFITLYFSYKIKLEKEENFSKSISKNYEIYRLYTISNNNKNIFNNSDILGTINIPKLNIEYPFFYGINDNLLRLSPCRFSGEMPPNKSNLCIAGHNYNDNRFFSKLNKLENNDLIIIETNDKNKFYYHVYDKFEITENEISKINKNYSDTLELTLLTCNNLNNKRIIIKAKTESL